MTHKTWLNKLKEHRTPSPEEVRIEKALMPRMKFMGYIFFGFAICSFCFVLFADFLDDPLTDNTPSATSLERAIPPAFFLDDSPDELDLAAIEVLNFYVISGIFAALSAFCFVFVYQKKKKLHTLPSHHKAK